MAPDPLQVFWDTKAITNTLGLWCRIVDTRNLVRMHEVFDADIVWDYGKGITEQGLENITQRIRIHLVDGTYSGATQHHLANMRVDVDGDAAESEAYVFAAHVGTGRNTGRTLLQWDNYHDFWKRRPAGWRCVKRKCRIDISDGPLEIVYGSVPPSSWGDDDARSLKAESQQGAGH